jgi:hypothetical protein
LVINSINLYIVLNVINVMIRNFYLIIYFYSRLFLICKKGGGGGGGGGGYNELRFLGLKCNLPRVSVLDQRNPVFANF